MGENKNTRQHELWYKQPAAVWEEALPVGNGRLGGMIFGGTEEELIQLNDDTLWSGFPRDTVNYEALLHLAPAKQLVAERKYKEAEALGRRGWTHGLECSLAALFVCAFEGWRECV